MAVQSRATATRQRIIDAAVELFTDHGFAETGLNDITASARITTGAFYYHFKSKEALATAIIEQGWPKAWQVFTACTNSPNPGLENVIVMTFSLSDLMKRDKSVWIANHLNGALGQLSEEGRRGFRQRATTFVSGVADSIRRSDIRDDVTPEAVGNMVWVTVHRCHLLSDAMMDNVFTRLAESWRMTLPAMVAEDSLPYFQQFLARTAQQFQPPVVDELTAKRHALLDVSGEQVGWQLNQTGSQESPNPDLIVSAVASAGDERSRRHHPGPPRRPAVPARSTGTRDRLGFHRIGRRQGT